jgi:hypothetical protein
MGEYPGSEWFLTNGTYGKEGHRGVEMEGRYTIARDVVWIRLPGYPAGRRMYFRSLDGSLATGVFNNGCMNIGTFTAEKVGK